MLNITYKFESTGTTITHTWHTGCPVPPEYDGKAEVCKLQADGDELDFILYSFVNIPHPVNSQKVVKWHGDMARFIVDNLRGL